MTLENIVLRKLAETTPSSERHHVLVTEGPWTVTVTADRRDDLSSRVWVIDVERRAPMTGNVMEELLTLMMSERLGGDGTVVSPPRNASADAIRKQIEGDMRR